MKKLFQNQKIRNAWQRIKPWATAAIIFVILRYTGALSGISFLTNKALLETGALNASTDELNSEESFDYDFKLTTLSGDVVDFTTFKGKTIFINLWATWCGPCRVEMPSIQELYNQVDRSKVEFVMLSLDAPTHTKKVEAFVKDKQYTFPIYRPHGPLSEGLNVNSIPTTLVISPEGKVVSRKVGTANYGTSKFKKFLEEL
jgi:thiol-disulfide isomerase/thioredoxin